jgi:hypothetical protein
MQTYIHTAELLGTDPAAYIIAIVLARVDDMTSQGPDQIPAELIQASVRIASSETHKFINFISNKKEMFQHERNVSLYRFIRAIEQT